MNIELSSLTLSAVAASAGAGAIFGRWAASLSARRSARQPVDVDVAAERALLAGLWTNPEHWPRVGGALSVDDFTSSGRAGLFTRSPPLLTRRDSATPDPETTSETDANRLAAAIVTTVDHDDWHLRVTAEVPEGSDAELERARSGAGLVSAADILSAGGAVVGTAEGRKLNTEASPLVATGDDEAPLRRVEIPASHSRRRTHMIASALGAAVGALFVASLGFSGVALVAAAVAVAATVAGGVVVSAVDHDTFYIDFGSFLPSAALGWAGTVVAVLAAGEPSRLAAGVGTGVAIGLGFELVARVWGKLRGKTQGGGDTLLVVVTAGVPAALVGSYQLGLGSMLAGSIALIVVWSVGRIRGLVDADTPFAYGPYLYAGAAIAAAADVTGVWGQLTAAVGLSGL